MLILALALAAADAPPSQILGGPAFEAYAAATERRCPQRHLRAVTPADLDLMEQTFEDQLPPAARTRISAADHARGRCAGRDGLSCQVGAALDAYRGAHLLGAFATYSCVHGRP